MIFITSEPDDDYKKNERTNKAGNKSRTTLIG